MKQIGTLFGTLVILALFAGCSGGESMRKESILKDTSIGRIEGARDGWDVISQPFGEVDDQEVILFTLRNPNGMIVELSNYGAMATTVLVPDRDGQPVDVVLGFNSLEDYIERSQYFGCTAGRVGNRIANGEFEIDGTKYTLATNNGPNHLHGGEKGFDKEGNKSPET